MESKTPIQELIDWINNPMDDLHSLLSKAREIRDTSEATLIAEHRLMKETLKRIESVYDWQEDFAGKVAHETLKNVTL